MHLRCSDPNIPRAERSHRIETQDFLSALRLSDEQLSYIGELALRGFLGAVLVGMALLLVVGTLSRSEWKEKVLRVLLVLAGVLAYRLSGIMEVDLEQALIEPVLAARDRPYVWLTVVPAALGMLGAFLLMRAVKSQGRRTARGVVLLGSIVCLGFGQLVLPSLVDLETLNVGIMVAGGSFGAGMVLYIAFIEDWRQDGMGWAARALSLLRREGRTREA